MTPDGEGIRSDRDATLTDAGGDTIPSATGLVTFLAVGGGGGTIGG